jgi:hypothetical protein
MRELVFNMFPPPPVPDAARINPALLILTNAFLSVVSIRGIDRHVVRGLDR